jgi:hypothetical protein
VYQAVSHHIPKTVIIISVRTSDLKEKDAVTDCILHDEKEKLAAVLSFVVR